MLEGLSESVAGGGVCTVKAPLVASLV